MARSVRSGSPVAMPFHRLSPRAARLSRYDLVSGIVAVGVDDSYYRERLADVVRLLYQEAGGRSSRSMTGGSHS
jgi:hypothetical protein